MSKKSEEYSLTSDDLVCLSDSIGGDLLPIAYSRLARSRCPLLECVLPHIGSGLAILYEVSKNIGHWTLLTRTGPLSVEFFDSYGIPPDSEELLGATYSARDGPVVSEMLRSWASRTGGVVTVNQRQLQDLSPDDNVCGRWVWLRYSDIMADLLNSSKPSLEHWLKQWPGPPAKNDVLIVAATEPDLVRCFGH